MEKSQREKECEILKEEIIMLRQRLTELTPPLEVLLKRRGFSIYKSEPAEYLLLPRDKYRDSYYELLKKYSFRLFLRDVIKHQEGFSANEATMYASSEVTDGYIKYLVQIGILKERDGRYQLKRRPIRSFGETLEWTISEILRREFRMETLWGVKFKGRKIGGDYDLIAKHDGDILYMEVKSSPPRQIYESEISAFWSRGLDICPVMCVFLLDTHLRMKDKIVPMFEEELKRRYKSPPPVKRITAELFTIMDRVFIINTKPSIEGNISTLISYYYKGRFM